VAVSFINDKNRKIPPTRRKSLTNCIYIDRGRPPSVYK